jgi:hypothetical protein
MRTLAGIIFMLGLVWLLGLPFICSSSNLI